MPIDFSKMKGNRCVLPLAVAVIAIGIIMTFVPTKETDNEAREKNGNNLYSYTENVETRLEKIIEKINGVNNASVMVTFESSFENVFASNARLEEGTASVDGGGSKNTEKELVLTKGKSGTEEPVLLKELCPRVKGVFIVCDGIVRESTVKEIKLAVSALFGVSESKICITSGGMS